MAELADYPVVIERGCAMSEGSEAVDLDCLVGAEASIQGGDSADKPADDAAAAPAAIDGEPFGGGYGSPPVTVAELEAAARRAAARRTAAKRR